MTSSGPTVEYVTDAGAFLAIAREHLAAEPMATNVIATVADRAVRRGSPEAAPYFWFAVVRDGGRDGGRVVGVAMRTAPFAPYPLFVGPMPESAAVAIARSLHERGEHPGGSNGALPAARVLAEEAARLWGGAVEVAMETRLYELPGADALVAPTGVPGRSRPATYDDLGLCLAWFNDFGPAARAQAGNAGQAQGHGEFDEDGIRDRIDAGRVLLWEDGGEVVHLTGFNPPALGVARIGPVYTPVERRGHGYASAAVAEVGRRLLACGARVCLFTDQANPVSNHVYRQLGFRAVTDMANHSIGPGGC